MKIITTNCVYPRSTDTHKAIIKLSELGFDGIDIGFDYCEGKNDPFVSDEYLDWAKQISETAKLHNISFYTSHSPGNAAKVCLPKIKRSIECAQVIGSKFIVLHPIGEKDGGGIIENVDEFLEVNSKAMKPILDFAGEHDVTVLSENLLWGASIDPKNIAKLVEVVNSPNFGWCYDTGHAFAFGIKPDILKEITTVPLTLHIQDCNGVGRDEHLIPGDGKIDWKEFMRTLKTIGYKGEFTLEAHHQALEAKDENERKKVLNELLKRSKELVAFYESL